MKGAKDLTKRKDVRQAALLGAMTGSVTGQVMGDRKGKQQSDAMYKSAGALTTPSVQRMKDGEAKSYKGGRTFEAAGNKRRNAKESLKAMAKKMPSAKRVGKSLGLVATVAGTGYLAHKATEAIQTPVSRVGRNIENTYLGKKKIK